MTLIVSQIDEGNLKADHWRNLVNLVPVALYCAWEKDGIIPDADAPQPRANTNASKAAARKEALLESRRREALSRHQDTTWEDLEANAEVKMDRNYCRHYEAVLEHCTSVRIYATRSITPNEVMRAAECHSRACRSWARMHCHLTPNFHLSEHNPDFILRYGLVPGWWCMPLEQNNGFLKKFKHNGHSGGELESTLMRGWMKYSLISDLVSPHVEI